jgi:hypothetical protein
VWARFIWRFVLSLFIAALAFVVLAYPPRRSQPASADCKSYVHRTCHAIEAQASIVT